MRLCFFFEGTGQGISGNVTNVSRLYDAAEASETQRLHLEAGPGTHFGAYVRGLIHGHDWWLVFPGSHSDVGGLFEDNHVVADAALAWIAEGAVVAGMELKDKKILEMPPETAEVVLHDAHDEATNLWGMLGRVKRVLPGLPLHSLCRKIFIRK